MEQVFLLDAGYIYTPLERGGGFGAGLRYERPISDNCSVGFAVGGMKFQSGYFKVDFRPDFRLYLAANAPAGLFIGLSGGYTLAGDGGDRFHFLALIPSAGYKFIFGYFVIDLSIGYNWLFDINDFGKPTAQTKGKILLGFGLY
jgi:hypothetical protein